ncbi:hypothetical protein SAY86_020855 [Trapa natans]|uniref:Arabinogalactan peptide 23-like n=1 Tax=Trapa natans TaxID=22666 RepID=A0AAN7M167_TRANT|nr:hypothetical protein SAY86_020855 [Trapa natans]
MEMKKMTCAFLVAAASMSAALAAESPATAPASGPSSGTSAGLPALGSLVGASLLSFLAYYLN